MKSNSFNLILVVADETEIHSVFFGNPPKRRKENETKGLVITPGWKIENQWHEDVEKEMLAGLSSADYHGFLKIGMANADIVINSAEEADEKIKELFNECDTVNTITPNEESLEAYYELYTELIIPSPFQ